MNDVVSNWAGVALWHGSVLIAGLALGCSGRVDLGGDATGEPPDPTTSEVETAAQTTNLMKMNALFVSGLALDGEYLYLASVANDESDAYYLQRCKKSDCWRSLTSIARLSWPQMAVALNVGQVGWVNEEGLQLCHTPDCRDIEVFQGVTFDAGSNSPFVWDHEYVYWYLYRDRAIYRCSQPHCDSGPELVASHARALDMKLVGDQLYWLDEAYGILRAATNGSAKPEQLTSAEQTTWVPLSLELPATWRQCVLDIAIDVPFIYAALPQQEQCSNGANSTLSRPINLVRWRYTEAGAARELLLTNDATFDGCTFIEVFDGEVVWGTSEGNLWSCLAEDCVATKRQFGVDGVAEYGNSIVADEQYVYWLSAQCDNTETSAGACNLKRTPRIVGHT
jgi:hypothetical protein